VQVGGAGYGGSGTTPGTGNIWLDELRCAGTEETIADCPHNPWGEHNCIHAEDLGLCCPGGGDGGTGTPAAPPEGAGAGVPAMVGEVEGGIKLSDCDGTCCRLDIYHDGEFGSICDDGATQVNPEPSTLNPKPLALSPETYTLNPKH